MQIKSLLVAAAIFIQTVPFSSCKKAKEDEEPESCEINKTGTINFNLSGRLSLDPVDVFVNGVFVDSLFVYAMNENEKDKITLTKSSGDYNIEYRETASNGGELVVAWDTTLNVCENMEISYFKSR
jgi:hypothetical protein